MAEQPSFRERKVKLAISDQESTVPIRFPGNNEMLIFWSWIFSSERSNATDVKLLVGSKTSGQGGSQLGRRRTELPFENFIFLVFSIKNIFFVFFCSDFRVWLRPCVK